MVDVINFADAIAHSRQFKKRHLLLGNGFSIACRPNIFAYSSLFEQADFTAIPELKKVFDALGTNDFEHVIKALEDASRALPIYDPSLTGIADQMMKDASTLKGVLISTVADNHPNIPNEIDDTQFWAARQFLSHFLGPDNKNGKVYSLNYDLLLYWALMHEDMPFGAPIELETNDGFGREDDTDPEYVIWMGESSAHGQRVHYLHGALHLFDDGADLKKYTWKNTGTPLLDQAREAMDAGMFPLFVAEGKSPQKQAKIKHSAYLHHSFKSFSAQMDQRNNCLFIFGHSLATNDKHILKKIVRGKVKQAYVGLHGPADSDNNKKIISAARAMSAQRNDRFPLEVIFFDAASAKPWEYGT